MRNVLVTCCWWLLTLLVPASVLGQGTTIDILNAGRLKSGTVGGEPIRKLIGDVHLRQDSVDMYCDSAYFYVNRTAVDAFGNVEIDDSGGSRIFSDSLKYDGSDSLVRFYSNVRLRDDRINLDTEYLLYNFKSKSAFYLNNGHVYNNDLDLTSGRGYYYADTENAYFSDSVVLNTEGNQIYSDTLQYNIRSEKTYFHGPTDIISPEREIYCEKGWYEPQTDVAVFGPNTVMKSEGQVLHTDSLHYEGTSGRGEAWKNFVWEDSAMSMTLSGKWALFYRHENRVTAADSALLKYDVENDPLYLTGDTLITWEDTVTGITSLTSYHDVRMYKSDLQGVCDSLGFSFTDSVIRMYRDPVLWNENNQLTGDTITIMLKNEQLHSFELFPNGFIVNEADPEVYNQVSGRHIYGFFKNRRLNRMKVEGSGQSMYYGKDNDGAYLGLNEAVCSNMWIYMANQTVDNIVFLTEPEATFHPMQQISPDNFLLKGFSWKPELRPNTPEDLFKATPAVKDTTNKVPVDKANDRLNKAIKKGP